eukprot:6464519-Alexandrium_andersonii.AAC.1
MSGPAALQKLIMGRLLVEPQAVFLNRALKLSTQAWEVEALKQMVADGVRQYRVVEAAKCTKEIKFFAAHLTLGEQVQCHMPSRTVAVASQAFRQWARAGAACC